MHESEFFIADDGFNIPELKTPFEDFAIPTAEPKHEKDKAQAIPK